MDLSLFLEHAGIEVHVAALEIVVQFLAQTRRDFVVDAAGIDGFVAAPVDSEDQLELLQVGLYRRSHIGILKLAGQFLSIKIGRPVDLAQRRGRRRLGLEAGETLTPVAAHLAGHAALDKGPAHGRRVGLKLGQLGGIFTGQRVGNGGQ
jgi:hypothetical protein